MKLNEGVSVVQFFEEDFLANREKYPMISDKSLLSSIWFNKKATDGRYHLSNSSFENMYNGDYILFKDNSFLRIAERDFQVFFMQE